MQPGFDLRIQTMIKALSDAVLPAIDRADKAAIEQTQIVIGSLALLREQIDYSHWFEVAEAQSLAAQIGAIAACAELPSATESQALASEALATAQRHDIRLSTLREENRKLRNAVGILVGEAFADPEAAAKVQAIVLEHGKAQIGRERAYVAGANFDVFPDDLRTIEEALTRPA